MTRPIRCNAPGVVYHLVSRFVDRDWFISTEEERASYLRLLGRAVQESDWRCIAYAVMSNHIHLAMIAGEEPLGPWIRRVHAPFADWMNRAHDRIGTMFVRGPKDYATPPDDVARLVAYIHNNPVRAGVVRVASESTWTSHLAYLGRVPAPPWLDVAEGLSRSGFSDAAEFDRWVSTGREMQPVDLTRMRRAARRRGAIEVGTPTSGADPKIPLVARPWAHLRLDPRVVVEAVADELNLPVSELCSRRRSQDILIGRRIAVHCGLALGLCGADMAAALGVSQQATSKIRRQGCHEPGLVAVRDRVLEAIEGRKLRK
jgi:REP element-mobilizing transposase RayT